MFIGRVNIVGHDNNYIQEFYSIQIYSLYKSTDTIKNLTENNRYISFHLQDKITHEAIRVIINLRNYSSVPNNQRSE